MANTYYTTRTAALKATTADINKLDAKKMFLDGKNILDYITENKTSVYDQRGTLANDEIDIWTSNITVDSEGNIIIDKYPKKGPIHAVKKGGVLENISQTQLTKLKNATSVERGEVKDGDNKHIMFWDSNGLTDGYDMFYASKSIKTFNNDLSSLVDGGWMFGNSEIESFTSDLSSLTNGFNMFWGCKNLSSFEGNLCNLINGENMFTNCENLSTFNIKFNSDLNSLVKATNMFSNTALKSFSGDLNSLLSGIYMFSMNNSFTSFSGNLNRLIDGEGVFYETGLTSFSGNLPKLINGECMFCETKLTSFDGDLSSLLYAYDMFSYTPSLVSFKGDLSSLMDGSSMFYDTGITSFGSDLSSLIDGYEMFQDCSNLVSFTSPLCSLKCGYKMFENCKLDEDSILIIADFINDITHLDKNNDEDWKYPYYYLDDDINEIVLDDNPCSVSSSLRGVIHIGFDKTVCDLAKVEQYCNEISEKGWIVYLNNSVQSAETPGLEGISQTNLIDGEQLETPLPHYYKPVEVDEKFGEYTNGEKFFILLGGQKVFGDDLSTYGMFVSLDDAITQIGLTKINHKNHKKH